MNSFLGVTEEQANYILGLCPRSNPEKKWKRTSHSSSPTGEDIPSPFLFKFAHTIKKKEKKGKRRIIKRGFPCGWDGHTSIHHRGHSYHILSLNITKKKVARTTHILNHRHDSSNTIQFFLKSCSRVSSFLDHLLRRYQHQQSFILRVLMV